MNFTSKFFFYFNFYSLWCYNWTIFAVNGYQDHGEGNSSLTQLKSKQPYLYNAFEFEDWERGKRGALHLAGIILCATGCNPLSFKGYGCFCGFMGAGEPVDGIDM